VAKSFVITPLPDPQEIIMNSTYNVIERNARQLRRDEMHKLAESVFARVFAPAFANMATTFATALRTQHESALRASSTRTPRPALRSNIGTPV
jgi:hypothetical protein